MASGLDYEQQLQQVMRESEQDFQKQQQLLNQEQKQEEDAIQRILKESELMAMAQGEDAGGTAQPDYLKQLEETS